MKIRSVCNKCFQMYDLVIAPEYSALLESLSEADGKLAKCPRLCGGKINLVLIKQLKVPKNRMYKEAMEITIPELHAAIYGNGLPDEIPKDELVLESLLLAHKVKSVETHKIHGGVYLDSLLLENGVRVHLAGGIGPRVVKLTKEGQHGAIDPK
jgi:hypothetical protein